MSYRAGGIFGHNPVIACDGCRAEFVVKPRGMSGPPAWLTAGKGPPKWETTKAGDGSRVDFCPACQVKS